jgi:hypothetical protein
VRAILAGFCLAILAGCATGPFQENVRTFKDEPSAMQYALGLASLDPTERVSHCHGASMRPFDYVAVIRKDYARLRAGEREIHIGSVGDNERAYIGHRAVEVRPDGYFSCGDTWPCATVWVPKSDYIGTVTLECVYPDSSAPPLLARR